MSSISQRRIVITDFDRNRLEELLEELRERARDSAFLDRLADELAAAQIVAPEAVPDTVVTMNSEVELVDLDSQAILRRTVVFPGLVDVDAGKISVVSSLGAMLLGAREGEELITQLDGRSARLRVHKVSFQPEAAGRFDL